MIDLHCIMREAKNGLIEKYQNEAVFSWPQDSRVNYHIIHDIEGSTYTENRTKGFSSGTSEYVGCLDDDDRVYGLGLIEYIDYVEKTKPVFIQSHRRMIDANGSVCRNFKFSHPCTFENVLIGKSSICHITLIQRDLALECLDAVNKVMSSLDSRFDKAFDLAFYLEVLKRVDCEIFKGIAYEWRKHSSTQYHFVHEQACTDIKKLYLSQANLKANS